MPIESASSINDLNSSYPVGATDPKSAGDDHLRLIKSVLKATFPGFGGAFHRTSIVTGGTLAPANTDNSVVAVFRTTTSTLNLPAMAGLTNGWYMWFYADGVGVTIDGNGSEKVNGGTSVSINAGEFGVVFCTGVAGDEFIALTTSNPAESVTATVRAGDIVMSAGASRVGALLCDGTAYSRSTYSALYAVIGTTYGVGDGATTFNVPDLRGRAPIGEGTGAGLTARTRGQTGGAETHSLSAAESGVPAHTHPGSASGASGTIGLTQPGGGVGYGVQVDGGSPPATHAIPYDGLSISGLTIDANTAAAASSAHNNMQPFGVVNYFIITGL